MTRDRANDLYAHLRQVEMRQHAERHRLIAQVRPARRYAAVEYTKRVFRLIWAWLGRRLIDAGQAMQSPVELVPIEETSTQRS
jgi:hypothetical protein